MFSLPSFTFIKRLLSPSSLSAIRVVSSAYLRLLIFLPAILIPACVSSRPAFLMMYSAYKLNKQGDNIQPWHTSFPIWNQSVVPCPVLTVASWLAYRFLKRQVRWSGIPISFCFIDYGKAFDCVDHNKLWKILKEMGIPDHLTCLLRNLYASQEATVRTGHGTSDWFQIGKGFGIVNKAEIDVFLELSCFFDDPADVGNLISGSSAFSKSSLNIWKFTVHILLMHGLEKFEHYFASVWYECNCVVVWAFFGTAFLWDWNENWPFPVLWPLLSFPNVLAYWVQHFDSIIF